SKLSAVQQLCARRGIIFPTAEIHGGYAGFYDFGPVGLSIKRKIIELWRKTFIHPYDFIVEMEGSLVLPERVFIASGHIKGFVDPITQCKKCKSIHRADHLIEDKLHIFVEGKSPEELTKIIKENDLRCPKCGGELSDVRLFNLMLKTEISPVGGQIAYLRPETAQNIFTSFQRVYQAMRAKLPFGIAQVGHSFRNEISPRKFIIRLREFTQAEIEMFFDPEDDRCLVFDEVKDVKIPLLTRDAQKAGKDEPEFIRVGEAVEKGLLPNEWMGFFLAKELEFVQKLGIPLEATRFRHMLLEETPHYSGGNFDMEIRFEFGWKEVIGNAYRTDYDLKNHSKISGKDLSVNSDGKKVLPHVVEPSIGLERLIAAVLTYAYREKGENRGWEWLKLPARIAPFIAGVFPLVSKDGLPNRAREIYRDLKACYPDVFYDEKGSIGKRYARADEIGVPICITIDYQTLEDNTVTLRDRDTTKQIRVRVEELKKILWEVTEGKRFEELKKS
ncbi:MAG: glycine--tRNA ligase, partial [Candidatus Aenigmarchaeota archaeon]|nr:glycine--tRNA ligase [Candidatus Aenigmarchaeota archaeon]